MATTNVPRIGLLSSLGVLSCLISHDEETKLHLAHCLNFDLMECGKSPDEAWENLKVSVKQYVEFCYENDQDGLAVSAEPEEWLGFIEALRTAKKPWKVEKIEFQLKAPSPEMASPIWMQGVSDDATRCPLVQ